MICKMHLTWLSLLGLMFLATISTITTENAEEVTTESLQVFLTELSTEEVFTEKNDLKKDDKIKEFKTMTLGEDDAEEEEEEEESCDMSLSSVVRNLDATPLLPDDYEEAYNSVTQTDFARKQYNITDMMAFVQRFIDYGLKVSKNKDIADAAMYVSSVMMDRIYDAKVSAECTADLANIGSGLRSGQLWPAKFLDSMGMLPSGMLTGHISSLGEYEQCLKIKSPVLENGKRIYGQYCVMQARSVIPKTLTINEHTEAVFRSNDYIKQAIELVGAQAGMDNYLDEKSQVIRILKELLDWVDEGVCFFHAALCVPASCSAAELETVINQVLYPLIKLPFRIAHCEKHQDITESKLDSFQWISIIVLRTVFTLATVSTLFHLYLLYLQNSKKFKKSTLLSSKSENDSNSKNTSTLSVNLSLNLENSKVVKKPVRSILEQFALTFSVVHNTKKLMSPVKSHFATVHSLTLLFTFLFYVSQAFSFGLLVTPQLLRNWVQTVPYKLISSDLYWFARMPSIWVDGLAFISGVSIVLQQFALLCSSRNRFFGYFGYICTRWYLLSVPMFGALMLLYLLPLVGDGPFWYINRNWLWPACTRTSSLASSFLYYSNWNPSFINYTIKDEFPVCNPPTWILSVLFQLYMLAPVVFLPLYRSPKTGITVLLVLLLLSPLATLLPYLATGKPTFLELTSHPSLTEMYGAFHQYTSSTFQYVTSMLIGLLSGYLIEIKGSSGSTLGGKVLQSVCWILSLAAIVFVFAWNNTFWVFNQNNSTTLALSWFVSSKFLFSGALAYITYMCATGKAGFLNCMLNFFQPIGKLSTNILMVSILTLLYRVTTPRHTYEMHFFQTLQNTIADFVITIFLAFFLHLLFEGPAMRILEILEGGQLFKQLKGTDSVEELKPKSGSQSESESSLNDLSTDDKVESLTESHNV